MQLSCQFMELAVTTDNCVDILNLAELYVLTDSRAKARTYILEHFESFAESPQYFKLNHSQLASLLDQNSLKVHFQSLFITSVPISRPVIIFCIEDALVVILFIVQVLTEYKLFELVLRWINHSKLTREQHVAELMSRLRLPLLSGEELVDKVCILICGTFCNRVIAMYTFFCNQFRLAQWK